jgi:hypothetical protein
MGQIILRSIPKVGYLLEILKFHLGNTAVFIIKKLVQCANFYNYVIINFSDISEKFDLV